jgi:bacillithiol biosynthesis cysteine-adding enzyme BshC
VSDSFHTFYEASGLRANAFFPWGLGDPAQRAARVALASRQPLSRPLLDEVVRQNQAWPSPQRLQSLETLSQPGTAVVITGQQVGLLLGPLYTLYKAASAVALARRLTEETSTPCVPLFWLQLEDHDFAEIAGCELPTGSGDSLRLDLAGDPARDRASIAHRPLGPDISALLGQLDQGLSAALYREEVLALFKRHYRPGAGLGEAFAGCLAEIFGAEGLLLYNPRQAAGARLAAPVLRKALLESERVDALLAQSGEDLRRAGYVQQIPPRSGSPLVFCHPRGPTGPRYRLRREGDAFQLLDGGQGEASTFSREQLLTALEEDPLTFSTSALLRPIVQDTLFPTAAYVGGNAEIDYFAQLGRLYPFFDRQMPLVAPRAHFRLVPPRVKRWLAEPGSHEVASTTLLIPPDRSWGADLERRLEGYAAAVREKEPGLLRAVERTRATIHSALERLEERAHAAAAERARVADSRQGRAQQWLSPHGQLQERVYGPAAFAAQVGWDSLRSSVFKAIDPLSPQMKDIPL